MGSPFNVCRSVRLDVPWYPPIPLDGFQDLAAESDDGRYIVLVRWDISTKNEPGFVVYTIDNVARTVHLSERQSGCCERVWWEGEARWQIA